MAGGSGGRSLEVTPTWAVAVVCAFFIILSVIIEHGIHSIGKWFQKPNKKHMSEALEKIKADIIPKICIPKRAGYSLLPCIKKYDGYGTEEKPYGDANDRRKLLSLAQDLVWRRALAGAAGEQDSCMKQEGKVSLISQTGIHQLHVFIFVLAVLHILYSVFTMVLGQEKMKKWKSWELQANSSEYQFTNNDPARFRLTHQTSFVKRHTGLSTTPGIRWVVAFFRQFYGSVTKVDYLTMRHGFINAHLGPEHKFDFHKYIKRSLEDDFKVVVGISIPIWSFQVVVLLLNVYEWHTLFWISFLPLIIILLVGMKLQIIIMELALQIQEKTTVVEGAPIVHPSNEFFWFNKPKWILFLIHFTLFQNAFQMAYFLWVLCSFGIKSCFFYENLYMVLIPVILGVVLQILCSYITFPLYALVTQMGSHMKTAIFEEQTAKALTKWRLGVKDKKKNRKSAGMEDGTTGGSSAMMDGENIPSIDSSAIPILHKHKTRSNDIDNVLNSPKSDYYSENEAPTTRPTTHG